MRRTSPTPSGADPSFDPGVFRAAVAENLRAGRFTLVVAVDSITDALQRSILYLSDHTGPDVDVVAMELGYVAHGDVEVLVPRTFGLEVADRRAPSLRSHGTWDKDSFDAALRELKGEAALELATNLREWALGPEVGLEVSYGRGATYGTEGFVIADPAGTRRSIFSLATSGWVTVELGNLKFFPAYGEEMPRLDVLHALARIEGRTRKDEQAGGWPQFSTDVLRDPARLADFKGLLGDIVSRIRER